MTNLKSKKGICVLLMLIILFPQFFLTANAGLFANPISNLVLKTTGGNIKPDYGMYIAKYLRDIGIEVEIQIEESSIFEAQLKYTHNFDIFISEFEVNTTNYGIFDFDSPVLDISADPCGIHETNWSVDSGKWVEPEIIEHIPYMGYYEVMVDGILNSSNNLEKRDLVFEFQELFMDKIIPFLPLFWNNLSTSFSYLGFNSRRPFLGLANHFYYLDTVYKEEYTVSIAIRKAICYAIDRKEMNEKLHSNDYEIVHSIISPSYSFWYNENVTKYYRNLDNAKDWLEAAGFRLPYTFGGGKWEPINTVFILSSVIALALIVGLVVLLSKAAEKIHEKIINIRKR